MKTKESFLQDVQTIYNYIDDNKRDINNLFGYLENQQFNKLDIIDTFANKINVPMDNNLRVALITRLVNLRDDSLVQVLKKIEYSEEQIIDIQEKAYLFVKDYWTKQHLQLIKFIDDNKLLTPFYRAIFKGVYDVGIYISKWQSSWTKHIINGVNKELLEQFDDDEAKIMEYLEKNNLFDKGHNNETSDRSYSALVKIDDKYESQAYLKVFKIEVTNTIDALENFADSLIELDDEVFGQKWDYILYIQAIVKALGEIKTNTLISRWADVDRAWMKITSPIQIGHPLEYYEDHFRKAVALEWDIRLTNPSLQNNNLRAKKLKAMFDEIYTQIDEKSDYKHIYEFTLKSLDKVQLYLGRPALFFGAEFNGLFSAQVVPNDEIVSKEEGKKIFAFSDEILQTSRAKPFLKLSRDIFGQDFLTKERLFLFKETKKWHQVYDITTIGHEFGHILWCDEHTESVMNKTGNFKNIEEFKATTGGLVSFFMDKTNDEKDCETQVITDTIKRSIGLIGWMEVDEVQPYYCEGLIHLSGLFGTNVLQWDGANKKLNINLDENNISNLKQWYIETYKSLSVHYLTKQDATKWLNKYALKDKKYFVPIDTNIKDFVKYYFEQYKLFGQELDTYDCKANYL